MAELEWFYCCLLQYDILNTILQQLAPPVEKYYIKTSKTPWWNLKYQNARRQRRFFEKVFRKNKSLENKSKYYAACKHANEV